MMTTSSGKLPFAKPSPLKVYFTGKNRAGSWEIRGNQIASGRTNWTASNEISSHDIKSHDLFVIVKRAEPKLVGKLKRSGKPVVFDVIDSWAQPAEGLTHTTLPLVKELFAKKWKSLGANAYIFPNAQMRADLGSLAPFSTTLYHHFRPGLEPIEVRKEVRRIGYEGNADFLGHWHGVMEAWCAKRGIEFVANPEDFRTIDIGFAARGGEHDSFMANRYKSNVKLANFYGAGIPCVVGAKEYSYHETDNGLVTFFETREDLELQLERLLDFDLRSRIHRAFLQKREEFRVERLCDAYELFFASVMERFKRGLI